MIYPLSSHNETITDASGEVVATVEPGPFGHGRIEAQDIVYYANLGYRTERHQRELENLSELKGEPSFAFSPSVMVEFTKEEFANFQTGLGALRQLSRRTETPEEKKVKPASTDIAEGHNPGRLTNEQVGNGFRLLDIGEEQSECDEWRGYGQWNDQVISDVGEVITQSSLPHRRRIS